MNRVLIGLCTALVLCAVRAGATNPEIFHEGSGDGVPAQGGRDVLWSQPGVVDGDKISSEIIDDFGLTSEVAGDFVLACDGTATITMVTWWGGQWGWFLGDPICTVFNIVLYDDDPSPDICAPAGDPIASFVDAIPSQTDLGYDPESYNTNFRYDLPVTIELPGGIRYWIVAQAANHAFPGQWGRMEAAEPQGCDPYFRSPFFSYPDWTPVSEFTTYTDASVELTGYCGGVPTSPTTWGAIRGLYR
jgi:hypothetical protein